MFGIRDLFIGIRYYTVVREAEKGSERGSWRIREKSLTGPSEVQCRWATQARKWEARSVQLLSGTPKENRWRHLWKTVDTASGSGLGVVICQQGQKLGTKPRCRTGAQRPDGSVGSLISASFCV